MKRRVELIFVPNYDLKELRKLLPYLVVQEELKVGYGGRFMMRFPSGDKIFSLATPEIKVRDVIRVGDNSSSCVETDIHYLFEKPDKKIFGQELAKYCYRVLATPDQIGLFLHGYKNGIPLMDDISEFEINNIISHGGMCSILMDHPPAPERTDDIHLNAVLFDNWIEIKDEWIPKLIDNKVVIVY